MQDCCRNHLYLWKHCSLSSSHSRITSKSPSAALQQNHLAIFHIDSAVQLELLKSESAASRAESDRAAGLCAGASRDRALAQTRKREASASPRPCKHGGFIGSVIKGTSDQVRLPFLAKDRRYQRAPPAGHGPLRLGESRLRRPRPARAGGQGAGIALLGSCCPV